MNVHHLHLPTSARHEFVEVPPGFRLRLERLIEEAIALLDVLDGDPELEEDGDLEPALGWATNGQLGSDRDEEDEPSLGWTGHGIGAAALSPLASAPELDCAEEDFDGDDEEAGTHG